MLQENEQPDDILSAEVFLQVPKGTRFFTRYPDQVHKIVDHFKRETGKIKHRCFMRLRGLTVEEKGAGKLVIQGVRKEMKILLKLLIERKTLLGDPVCTLITPVPLPRSSESEKLPA